MKGIKDVKPILFDKLVIRNDVYAVQNSDGSYHTVQSPLTTDVYISDDTTVGAYQLDAKNQVKWVCFDIDINKNALARVGNITAIFEQPLRQQVQNIQNVLHKAGFQTLVEFSGMKGYHIWIIFDSPVSASQVRKCFLELENKFELVDERLHWEVFPKQDLLRNGGYGNLVKLPLQLHRKSNRKSYFVDENFHEFLPVDIPMNSKDLLESSIVSVGKIDFSNVQIPGAKVENMVSKCEQFRKLEDKAIKTGYLNHDERIWFSNLLLPFGKDGRNYIHRIFSKLKDYNNSYTENQLNSLHGKPSRCSVMCGQDRCLSISETEYKSPFGLSFNKKKPDTMGVKCKDFFLTGKSILELGIINDVFFIEEVARDTFLRIVKVETPEQKNAAVNFLIDHKRIKHLSGIEMIGDITATDTCYTVNRVKGVIQVRYGAIATDIKDNGFIDDYLNATFGNNCVFIKEYLSVLVYTNYKRLPYLILGGPRASGKSVFAEFVGSIFPSLTTFWSGDADNFSYETENKVLIVEENIIDKRSQYNTLKKYGGQSEVLLHKKYKDPIKVRNNMNVILLSNDKIPMFVEKDELPVSVLNNQLFVWTCPLVKIIDPTIAEKLKRRLGHYIRTDLKQVYDNLDLTKSRYSISVPITKYERDLFANNITNREQDSTRVLDALLDKYATKNGADCPLQKLLKDGYLPVKLIRDYNESKSHDAEIIKYFVKRGIITNAGTQKRSRSVNGVNFRGQCYDLSVKTMEQFNENN